MKPLDFSPFLQTTHLVLSPLTLRDAVFFFRLVGNQDVRRYLGGPVPFRHRWARFKAYQRGHPCVAIWAVRAANHGRALGLVELSPHKDGQGYEISYQFTPQTWGRGVARDAVARVIDHARNDLTLSPLIAETQAANERSCKLLESLGFVEQNRLERFGAQQIIFSQH